MEKSTQQTCGFPEVGWGLVIKKRWSGVCDVLGWNESFLSLQLFKMMPCGPGGPVLF